MRPPPRRPSGPGPLSWLLILVVLALALALPLLGAWVASTLVVHHEASRELAVAAGLGLSLVFPLAWELLSLPPRPPGGPRPQRLLRLRTRLLLRTWTVNLLFLAGALLLSPRGVFTALSTRGDWMLPASGGPAVETARRLLFKAADGVEWAYVLATDNPYREQLIAIAPRPSSPAKPAPAGPETPAHPAQPPPVPPPSTGEAAKEPSAVPPPPVADTAQTPPDEGEGDVLIAWKTEPRPAEPAPLPAEPEVPVRREISPPPQAPPQKPAEPLKAGGRLTYPLPAELHPRVTSLPRSVETDLASVARHLVSNESDPFQRIKALHDFVANHVEYDVAAYRARTIPPQLPETVFQNRRGVCAGYANLLAAMGKAVGEEVVTISGDSITPAAEWDFEPHAWNAVRIEGEWYLVDATWNAGFVHGDLFTRRYTTDFLFMPPREFLKSHIPEDPAWQLLDEPLDRGEALRQARAHSQARYGSNAPTDKPRLERPPEGKPTWEGIRIRAPSRPRAEVKGRFHVELDNPRGLPAQVSLLNTQDGSQEPCHPEYGGSRYACTVLGRGLYRIQVLAGPRDTNPQVMAQLEVTAL